MVKINQIQAEKMLFDKLQEIPIAELFASNSQTNIVNDMKKKLDEKFASPEHAGPADIAAFIDSDDEEEIAFIKRDAYEQMQALLKKI